MHFSGGAVIRANMRWAYDLVFCTLCQNHSMLCLKFKEDNKSVWLFALWVFAYWKSVVTVKPKHLCNIVISACLQTLLTLLWPALITSGGLQRWPVHLLVRHHQTGWFLYIPGGRSLAHQRYHDVLSFPHTLASCIKPCAIFILPLYIVDALANIATQALP